MAKITLDIPDELCDQLAQAGDRLPELLCLSLQQPAIPAHIYLKCRLEGTLGFTSEMKGSASIEQRSTIKIKSNL